MRDEYANRLAMFRTCLNLLNDPARKPIWHQQAPLIFTTKVTSVEQAVTNLEDLVRAQSAVTNGATEQKAREEGELEDTGFLIGSSLGIWFRDHQDESNAAQVELTISGWRRLRNQELLEKARTVRDLTQAVVSGPQATAAIQYSLTAAEVTLLTQKINDYAAVITAPQQVIASRKAITQQLTDRFNEVEALFQTLDALIIRFNSTPDGLDLITAYESSRTIRDTGHGPTEPTPPTPPTP